MFVDSKNMTNESGPKYYNHVSAVSSISWYGRKWLKDSSNPPAAGLLWMDGIRTHVLPRAEVKIFESQCWERAKTQENLPKGLHPIMKIERGNRIAGSIGLNGR